MASNLNLNINDNGFRASKLLLDGGGYLTKQMLLQHAIKGTTSNMDEFLAEITVKQRVNVLKGKYLVKGSQYDILYPNNGNPTNLDEWDITLVTLILNNCCTLSQAETDAIKEIRGLRNSFYGHTTKMEMEDAEFHHKWADISLTLTKHVTLLTDPTCAQFVKDLIAKTRTEILSADKTIVTLKQWYDWGLDVEHKIEEMTDKQKTSFDEAETKCEARHRENQDRLSHIETLQSHSVTKLSTILKLIKENKEECVDRTELNIRKKEAKDSLQAHTRYLKKFNIPCENRMTETVTQQLKKNKIVVLKGLPGSGKTHLAKNVLNNFLSLNPETHPLILRQPNEIRKVLDPDESFVLLVDDMIGKLSFDSTECKNWLQYIKTFTSQIEVRDLYVVVTIRAAIFMQCQNEEMSTLFATKNIIDTDEYLSDDEKRSILELYRKYHNMVISSDQADKIVQQQSVGIGFPFLCTIMQSHDVDQLFKLPTKYLETMISPTTSKDTTLFVLLFMTLVGDNILSKHKDKLTDNQKISFEELQHYFKASNMDLYLLYQTAEIFETTFLLGVEKENKFEFIHEAVAHATFKVALDLVPNILIEQCPFDSLISNMNLISETADIESNKLNPCLIHQHLIIKRMIKIIAVETNANIKSVSSSTLWNERAFVNEALRLFGDIAFFSRKDETGMSMICYFARNGQMYPLQVFVDRIQIIERNNVAEHLQKALKEACATNKKECVDFLISKVDINKEVVISAVKGGQLDIVQQIISQYGKHKISTLREEDTDKTLLHIAAQNGIVDLVTYVYQACPNNLNKKDKIGCNVAHSAAISESKYAIECLNFFIKLGINPRDTNITGDSILNRAALAGNVVTVKHICKSYPDLLNITDNNGSNALHDAAHQGNVDCVKFLIAEGIHQENKTKDEETILHRSAAGGNIATMKYIYEKYPKMLHETDKNGLNLLQTVAIAGNVECAKFVVDKGINPKDKCINELSILHLSALGGQIPIMKYICETHPELLRDTDVKGNNALHYAASEGSVECMKFLVEKGLNPGDKNYIDDTILHCSASGGIIETTKYVFKTFPDLLFVKENFGKRVFSNNATKGTVQSLQFFIDQEIKLEKIKKLETLPGNISTMQYICKTYPELLNVTNINGCSALHFAANNGSVECVKFLSEQGIKSEDTTYAKETLLHQSAAGGNIFTMKYIHKKYPFMLDVTDNNGNTALHHAASKGNVECMKYLVDQGTVPGVKTKSGETILHRSALGGNIATMKYIQETYPDMLHVTDIHGNNALHNASHGGSVECMNYLVGQGINSEVKTKTEETILHRSILAGNLTIVKYIHETYSNMLHDTDIHGHNALHYAAHRGTVECMKFLVDQGIVPGGKTKTEETILHRSAIGGNIATMKYIQETYPDMLNVTDTNKNNALHKAAHGGSVECMKYLVDQRINSGVKTKSDKSILQNSALGGNIATMKYIHETYSDMLHATNIFGHNALHVAAHRGTVECIKFLVDQGIVPGGKTKTEETILHLSAIGGNITTMKYINETYPEMLHYTDIHGNNVLHKAAQGGSVECIKYLVDHGIAPGVETRNEETILHKSAICGNIATMKYIQGTYPDMLHATDIHGNNALHEAAHAGSVECIKYLVAQGITPEFKTKTEETILHRSALSGNEATIEYINGSYPDMLHVTDIYGNTALHHAAYRGTVECVKFLVDKGLVPEVSTTNEATILHRSAFGGNITTMKYIQDTYPEMLHYTDIHGNNVLHDAARGGSVECIKYLVDQGINSGIRTKTEETILHLSAVNGNEATIDYINGSFPEMLHVTDIHGNTALHHAAYRGTVECVKFLVDKGIVPEVRTKNEETILHRSAIGGNIATMKYINETYPEMLHYTDIHGNNALHKAAHGGSVECIKYLVDQGIVPGVKTKNEETILHRSALGGNIATMKYIQEAYPDMLHATDSDGNNALHEAAHAGPVECIKYLVAQGITPEFKTKTEETILHRSALSGNEATIEYINGSYPDMLHVTDINGNTALHHAAYRGTVECVKFLVDKGIVPEVRTTNEATILHRSAFGGNITTMKYIQDTYPEMLHYTDIHGNNVLHNAAQGGSVECIKYLVDQGISPGVKTKNEETILHRSAIGGKIATMKYIQDTYPDMLHVTDIYGNNALHKAASGGSVECIKYLVDQGITARVKTKNEETILHRSALGGNIATMKYIQETYPDLLHETCTNGNTALHYAAARGTCDFIKYLVDQGIDPGVKTKYNETILHLSTLCGNTTAVKYISETYPDMLSMLDNNGNLASTVAANKGNVECLNFLLKQRIYPGNKTNYLGNILLQSAVGGNIATMKYICETYPELLHVTDNRGNNALHHSAFKGNFDCFKLLIEKGIKPEDTTYYKETILHRSAAGGNISILKYICGIYPQLLHATAIYGKTALHDAAAKGTVECIKFIIDQRIDPKVKTKYEKTILHLSARNGNIATMKYINETYPDMLHAKDIHGNTALHEAACRGSVECIKFLVDQGIDIRVKTINKETILHRSAIGGNISTLKYICEAFPDMLHVTDIHRNSALHHAAEGGSVECMRFLVDKKIEPGVKTRMEETILHRSAVGGNISTMRYIHEAFPDMLHVIDIHGNSALHDAALRGTVTCMKFLVDQGINPRVKTNYNETILHRSNVGGNPTAVEYICDTYPDILSETDNRGNTASLVAANNGNVKCLNFLLDQGIYPGNKTNHLSVLLFRSAVFGNIATMKYICDTYPELLHVKDNTGNNALHFSAFKGNVDCIKLLIKNGMNPREKTYYKESIFHRSAAGGNVATVKYICEIYPDLLHDTAINGNTALHEAACRGSVECVKFLISQRIDPKMTTTCKETILHLSAKVGNLATMEYICKNYPELSKLTDNRGNNALHCATLGGNTDCVTFLLDQGINYYDINNDNETILHLSALSGNMTTLKHTCERFPELLQSTDKCNRTALYHAVLHGNVDCIKFLVKQGNNPKAKTFCGESILHFSAMGENIENVKYICETYPDLLHLKDNSGNNALHEAAQNGTVECMKLLIDAGIHHIVQNRENETILHMSAIGGNISTMEYICETYWNMLHSTDSRGNNALHSSALYGTSECVKFLVEQGLDPGVKTFSGETILHRAALGGNMATVKYICEYFPELLHLTDDSGKNALYEAARNATSECAHFLSGQGLLP